MLADQEAVVYQRAKMGVVERQYDVMKELEMAENACWSLHLL